MDRLIAADLAYGLAQLAALYGWRIATIRHVYPPREQAAHLKALQDEQRAAETAFRQEKATEARAKRRAVQQAAYGRGKAFRAAQIEVGSGVAKPFCRSGKMKIRFQEKLKT